VNWLLAIPFELRLVAIFALGALSASWLNLAIYRLAWNPRSISPWSAAPEGTRRHLRHRVPIVGWWGRRHETDIHGPGFWVRPMLLEISVGLLLAGLYWWEVGQKGLLLPPEIGTPPDGSLLLADWQTIVHLQFAAHVLLFYLMLVASFIDIDEKIIPDTVTVPGTLAGLLLAAMAPWSLLSGNSWLLPGSMVVQYEFLHIASPQGWPTALTASPNILSLIIGLACWWGWCFAIMPRRWMTRRGLLMACKILLARLQREPATWYLAALGLVGTAAIGSVWMFGSAVTWVGLLTSLVGMAAGGGLVWLVRIIGTNVLQREAMGFGDVTLMAMVGAFLGWQSVIIAFFLAPFAGVVLGIAQWILHRDQEIPYGPFLCLASAAVVVTWAAIWQSTQIYFETGWLVPGVLGFCLIMLGVLLGGWRKLLSALGR
jgi:prepilin signal peptidase PulO-like enzyme (type II secretory pathway)